MEEEKITIGTRRRKNLEKLQKAIQNLGFTNIRNSDNSLIIEKMFSEDLSGRGQLDYRITFAKEFIEMAFTIPPKTSKQNRLLVLFPAFFNAIMLADDYYEIKAKTLFIHLTELLTDITKVIGKDAIDLSTNLDDLKKKHNDLSKKYADLVQTSEENARLLMECERRRDELHHRTHELEKLSDEVLREELFNWVKLHDGSIDMTEFCKAYGLAVKRVEEGLEMLIRDGYIKRINE